MDGPSGRTDQLKRRQPRAERLRVRVTPDQKALFRQAARLQSRSLNEFVVDSLQEAAKRAQRDHETMSLGPRDSTAFAGGLPESPEPSERLQAAYRRYRQHLDGQ